MQNQIRQGLNPYLPLYEYIPDAEPHVFGDRIYIYGSHDKERGNTYCMLNYTVWSAPVDDLTNWRCEGDIYSSKQDPLSNSERPFMFAPDVVRGNDGRYYLYYCLSGYKGKGGYYGPISVAVCDSPAGRYEYYGVVKNPDGSTFDEFVLFDPALINDNGRIHLYYGTLYLFDEVRNKVVGLIFDKIMSSIFGKTKEQIKNARKSHGSIMGPIHVELKDDMLTVASQPSRIHPPCVKGTSFEQHPFFEASSIRKVGEIYYFIYSSRKGHELCYATSKYPDRDFKYGGVIISNGDIGYQGRKPKDRVNATGTNHGSIEKIGDSWYVFYHRGTHRTDYSRQGCAEKIQFQPDGSIKQVEVTSLGLNNSPLLDRGIYPAPICCNLSNRHMPHVANRKIKGGFPAVYSDEKYRFIADIKSNTFIGYKYFSFQTATKMIVTIRGNAVGKLLVKHKLEGEIIGIITISSSNDWTQFETDISITVGTYPLYFIYLGKGSFDMLQFEFK